MPTAERYLKPSDLPEEVPVFPLRGAILLPRATLTLNVFEPRYLAMIDWVLRQDRVVGIIQPVGGIASEESPLGKECSLQAVGCVGRLTAFQELDDRRLLITLKGICRFRVKQEVSSDTPFRIIEPSYDHFVGDFEQGSGEDEVDRHRLLDALRKYLDANQLEGDWNSIERASSEALINALSVMSPYGPEEKQALLEADDLKTRADVLIALAEMEIASGGGETGGTLQ